MGARKTTVKRHRGGGFTIKLSEADGKKLADAVREKGAAAGTAVISGLVLNGGIKEDAIANVLSGLPAGDLPQAGDRVIATVDPTTGALMSLTPVATSATQEKGAATAPRLLTTQEKKAMGLCRKTSACLFPSGHDGKCLPEVEHTNEPEDDDMVCLVDGDVTRYLLAFDVKHDAGLGAAFKAVRRDVHGVPRKDLWALVLNCLPGDNTHLANAVLILNYYYLPSDLYEPDASTQKGGA